VGGYLVIKGSLDIGTLVAVIAAYKDLPSPIKELIDWDQQRMDVQIKYTQVVEQFSVDDLCRRNADRGCLAAAAPQAGHCACPASRSPAKPALPLSTACLSMWAWTSTWRSSVRTPPVLASSRRCSRACSAHQRPHRVRRVDSPTPWKGWTAGSATYVGPQAYL
jgi:hypothetical protein